MSLGAADTAILRSMSKSRRHYGIDINSYLGVEFPEDRIKSPSHRKQKSRRQRPGFAFRDSLVNRLSHMTTPSIMLRDTSNSIRRWRNSQGSSSGPTTPVADRNLTVKSAYFNATPTGNTTFLPTLHSTPPMPTFQKPDMQRSPTTPTGLPIRKKKENGPPRIPTPVGDSTTITTSFSPKPYMPIVTPARGLPSGATTTRKLPHSKASDSATDRVQHTESLPEPWTTKQDRLICVQDAKGRSLEYIVKKLKEECPEFEDQILTTEMVDKRLRILDFDLTWNGWSEGLKEAQVSAARRERKGKEKARKGDEAEVSLESGRSGESEKGSRVGL